MNTSSDKNHNMQLLIKVAAICILIADTSYASDEVATKSPCNFVCGRDYNPICARHGNHQRTFSNLCTMKDWNCQKEKNFVVLGPGECSTENDDD